MTDETLAKFIMTGMMIGVVGAILMVLSVVVWEIRGFDKRPKFLEALATGTICAGVSVMLFGWFIMGFRLLNT